MSGFATTQFFRNLPLLLVKNVPARLLPIVLPRFVLVYSLMVLYQFRRGQARPALRGVAAVRRSRRPAACRDGGRSSGRGASTRRSVRELLWPGLPPGMRVAAWPAAGRPTQRIPP